MLSNKKLFLFDIDGVIKLGNDIIDGSYQLLEYINKIGGKYIFITNNSTTSNKDYVQKFKNFGFEVDESNFITALSITIDYLKSHFQNELIFALGSKSFISELKENGLKITEEYSPEIKTVLVGYDNELTYKKILDVCEILQTNDVTSYLATNMDLRCPMPYGFVPDCGAIAKMIELATERSPQFLGKPSPQMVQKAMKITGFTKEQTLVIGDRLYTDIACGVNAGVDTCLVLSGEAKREDLKESSIQPTYVFESVKELLNNLLSK